MRAQYFILSDRCLLLNSSPPPSFPPFLSRSLPPSPHLPNKKPEQPSKQKPPTPSAKGFKVPSLLAKKASTTGKTQQEPSRVEIMVKPPEDGADDRAAGAGGASRSAVVAGTLIPTSKDEEGDTNKELGDGGMFIFCQKSMSFCLFFALVCRVVSLAGYTTSTSWTDFKKAR